MAKRMAILAVLMVFTASFLVLVRAFLPCRWYYGDSWGPFKVLDRIPEFISKIMEDPTLVRTNWKETPKAHVLTLDAPGMKKEDIKIEVDKKRVITITMSGERGKKEEKVRHKWYRRERSDGKFRRQFRLPADVDLRKIKADLENGVLTVTVPKNSYGKTRNPKIVEIFLTGDVIGFEL